MGDRHLEPLSPRLLLSLWRGRWGKTDGTAAQIPYRRGNVNRWASQLADARAWAWPGVTVAVAVGLVCLGLLFLLLIPAHFKVNDQLVFSAVLLSAALYLGQYAGRFVSLMLIGLSALVSSRYLYWRFATSAASNSDWEVLVGLGLCLAELYLCLQVGVDHLITLWPLRRKAAALPDDPATWPTVDVLLVCQEHEHEVLKATAIAARGLDWPMRKIKLYLLDPQARADIAALAVSLDASVLTPTEPAQSLAKCLGLALATMKGEYVVVLAGDQPPAKNLVRTRLGSMLRDARLAMVQSAHHMLSPAPSSRSLEVCPPLPDENSYAIVRRSAWLAVVAAPAAQGQDQTSLAQRLSASGYACAYLGRVNGEWVQLDLPFNPRSVLWRQRLSALPEMLSFYYALPRLIFYTAPLAYLLAGVHLLRDSGELWAAYAVPHFLHSHVARVRLQGQRHLPLWADLRETALSWYLLLPTTWALVKTQLSRFGRALADGVLLRPRTWFETAAWPYVVLLALHLMGVSVALAQWIVLSAPPSQLLLLYGAWSLVIVMLVAARLAVDQEAQHIRREMQRYARMPAMVRLPSGRTIACTTENFPETELVLVLPTAITIALATPLHLSIFRGDQEFSFSAQVCEVQEQRVRLRLEDAAIKDYQALGLANLTRGADWPQWLPQRDEDNLLTRWIKTPLVRLYAWLSGALAALLRLPRLLRFVRPKRS